MRRGSFLRRLSLRRRNSKRQRTRHDRAETRVDSIGERKTQRGRSEVVESQSLDSFSGSGDFEWGGDDGSPNNNDRQGTDEQYQSSYYQSPSEQRQSGSHYDYNYPTVIDDYNHVWDRSSTFGSQNQPVSDPPSYQHPVPIIRYSAGPYVNPNVSIIEIS